MSLATSCLESVNIPSGNSLSKLLSSTTNPTETIAKFQNDEAILLPSLLPCLPLLDLHKVSRFTFHDYVVKSLRATLQTKIDSLAKSLKNPNLSESEKQENLNKMLQVLEKSFPLVQLEVIRPIIMFLVKALDTNTPDKYLRKLALEPSLYKQCSIEIKQLVWQKDSKLFHNELEPLIKTVLRLRNASLTNIDPKLISFDNNFLTKKNTAVPRVLRPGADIVEKIAKMCRHSSTLYSSCIEYLRIRFKETKCLHFCTLRSEIIMYLHDLESSNRISEKTGENRRIVRSSKSVLSISDAGPHRIAWCADALIKSMSQKMDEITERKKIIELETAIAHVVEPAMEWRSTDTSCRFQLYDSFMILGKMSKMSYHKNKTGINKKGSRKHIIPQWSNFYQKGVLTPRYYILTFFLYPTHFS